MNAPAQPIDTLLPKRLADARLQAGLTVRMVAEQIGVGYTVVVKYERGTIVPPFSRLMQLAELYGMTVATLVARSPESMALIALIEQAPDHELGAIEQVLRTLLVRP